MALSPSSTHLLTGGQEKKARIFDLNKPESDPIFLTGTDAATAHEGTIKSVVWVGDHTGVTAGEDGIVKYVSHTRVFFDVQPLIILTHLITGGGIYVHCRTFPVLLSKALLPPWSSRHRRGDWS